MKAKLLFLIFCFISTLAAAEESLPNKLSELSLFSDLKNLVTGENVYPYSVNFPTWADGATKQRWIFLPAGQKIEFKADQPWGLPDGTILIKQFSFERKVETRLIFKKTDQWQYVSYLWDDNQEDATRVDETIQVPVYTEDHILGFKWSVPSPKKCLMCHSADNNTLGFKTSQFGPKQISEWSLAGLFQAPVDQENLNLSFLPDYGEGELENHYSTDQLARAYLDVNCSTCHRPNGFVPTNLNFDWKMTLEEMNALNVKPNFGNMGVQGAKIITPGIPEKSLVTVRMEKKGSAHMPYFGTKNTDQKGLIWIQNWIKSLTADE